MDAMNIPVAGRSFTLADNGSVPRVTIINETLARQVFGANDPIGRHILASDNRRPYRVVGVARDARITALARPPEPTMYFHYRQFSWGDLAIVATTGQRGDSALHEIRAAVNAVDPALPVFDERSMDAVVDAAASAPRMIAMLLTTFAFLALLLAAIGIYGVMSYTTAQRTSEMSLRLILGAQPGHVFALVYRHGLSLATAGIVLGIGAAAIAAGSIRGLLFQVSALDPSVYALSVAAVLIIAVGACGIPARRAMCVDPNAILRQD